MATRRDSNQGGRSSGGGRGGSKTGAKGKGRDTRAPGGLAGKGRAPRGGDERIKNPYQRFHKLERPALKPATTSLWSYPHGQYGKGVQGDPRFVGATPSWVIWQFLHRYTRPGQRVLDPFCGSGTTLDVCHDLDREGVGFDLAPIRDDIQQADARAIPLAHKSVDHAFFDPPYADNLAYSDDDNCIGRLKAEGGAWHDAMGEVFAELVRVVRPGGYVAGYVQDTVRPKGATGFKFFGLGIALAQIGLRRLELIDHVAVIRGHQKLNDGREHRKAETGALIRGFNHLLIFRVPRSPGLGPKRADRAPRGAGSGQRPASRGQKANTGEGLRRSAGADKPNARPPRGASGKKPGGAPSKKPGDGKRGPPKGRDSKGRTGGKRR